MNTIIGRITRQPTRALSTTTTILTRRASSSSSTATPPSSSRCLLPRARQRRPPSIPPFNTGESDLLRTVPIPIVQTQTQRWHSSSLAAAAGSDDPDEETTRTTNDVQDYFAMLGVPRRFDLDLGVLRQNYLQLMNSHHPDKQKQQPDRDDSSELTANDITNAYQVLTEPHTRADHLLELVGHAILEDNRPKTTDNPNAPSPSALVGMEFLMNIMEYRERIETLALCSKHADDGIPCSCGSQDKDAELRQMYDETHAMEQDCEATLAELWRHFNDQRANGSSCGMSKEQLEQARTLTAQLQYWHRLEGALKEEMEV